MMAEVTAMATILDDCQRNIHAHRRGLVRLGRLLPKPTAAVGYFDSDSDDMSSDEDCGGVEAMTLATFVRELASHVKRLLLVYKREPAVERVVDFLVQFCSGNQNVAVEVLKFVVPLHNAKDKAVRFRVCQFMERLLGVLDEDAEVEDSLWSAMQTACLARARDKNPPIRAAAAKAMVRLQTPPDPKAVKEAAAAATVEEDASDAGYSSSDSDSNDVPAGQCPVIAELQRLMATDASSTVREAATAAICINGATLPAIVERSRDVNKAVRAAAFQKLQAVMGKPLDTSSG